MTLPDRSVPSTVPQENAAPPAPSHLSRDAEEASHDRAEGYDDCWSPKTIRRAPGFADAPSGPGREHPLGLRDRALGRLREWSSAWILSRRILPRRVSGILRRLERTRLVRTDEAVRFFWLELSWLAVLICTSDLV